jgi:hypothetical protein
MNGSLYAEVDILFDTGKRQRISQYYLVCGRIDSEGPYDSKLNLTFTNLIFC